MWGKQWDAKCLLRTWSQGWRPGAPVPNPPRLGCRLSLSHPNQWKLLGHNVDRATGRGLLRSEGGQASPCTPPQGAHLPKPAGWEWRGRGAEAKGGCQNKQHLSPTAGAALAGLVFLREGGFSSSFHQNSWEICQHGGAAFPGAVALVQTRGQRTDVIPPPTNPQSQVLIQG